MFEGCRPMGRLFYCLLAMAMMAQAQGPATTTVSDTVYRADGNPAGGTLLISWPAFTTADGQTVAAGTTSASLGTGGALTVNLVPNAGATPPGTLYTVVYQLNDGTAKTEYWSVPTSSPATIAQVRTPLGVTGSVAQLASQQYVNTAIASKANDAAVVHLAGAETVSGTKTFEAAPSVPTPVQSTEVHYRGLGRALTRVTNPASVAAQAHGSDDGIRSVLRHVKEPAARTAVDCENAALTILEGATGAAWSGEYQVWSDFLPGGAVDIFPGDGLQVNVATRGASFQAVVREVEVDLWDLAGERSQYKIRFADDSAAPLGFEFDNTALATSFDLTAVANTQIGNIFLADVTAAAITAVSSTTISVDAGGAPPSGGGFEVRWSDIGWGPGNSRNLVGRFGAETFTLPRLSRVQTVFLRQYDGSTPPKYSRYSAALHVDYPL